MDTIRRTLIIYIRRYIELQRTLLAAFKEAFPDVSDWEFLLDAPKSGEVIVDGESWLFRKHGAGLSFRRADGVTIDAHRHLSIPVGIDAWRLLEYIESIDVDCDSSLSERCLEKELAKLEGEGQIVLTQHEGLYRLAG
jgi:hypothetical protein